MRHGCLAVGALAVLTLPSGAFSRGNQDVKAILERLAPGESATVGTMTFTMRQRQAGVPDADGWYAAESADGGFRVRLPTPFNEFSTLAPGEDGIMLASDTVGGVTADGARFLVNCMSRSDGSVDPTAPAKVAESFSRTEPSALQRAVLRGRTTGMEVRLNSPTRGLFVAQFLVGSKRFCQVSVEQPVPVSRAAEALAQVFLDSFALVAGE